MTLNSWRLIQLLVLATALTLRLWDLTVRPLHHDEGVNGHLLLTLINQRTYTYDPANYHGPTLYYFTLLTAGYLKLLFGRATVDTLAIRLVPVPFGVGAVWLALSMRRWIGGFAAVTAACLLALSPGAVFFSRYYIHESLLVFFVFGFVVSMIRYCESRRFLYLAYAAASAGLAVATKETVVISAAVLALAAALAVGAHRRLAFGACLPPGSRTQLRHGALAATIVAATIIVFYSAFLTNFPQGVYDAFRSLQFWTATASAVHAHPWYTYLEWLSVEDPVLLGFAALGALLVLWRSSPMRLFLALWASGMLAAYSLIPYKAPWLALNVLIPMALVAGAGAGICWEVARRSNTRIMIVIALGVAFAFSTWRAARLNFIRYDDEVEPYVYVHTRRQIYALLCHLAELVDRRGGRQLATISVVSPEYWPLPWYLRPYRVGYPGRLEPGTDATILIASHRQSHQMQEFHTSDYDFEGSYPLRPGVDLLLYLRKSYAPNAHGSPSPAR
jgi:uncharacterized protein (TIGR03663 family)